MKRTIAILSIALIAALCIPAVALASEAGLIDQKYLGLGLGYTFWGSGVSGLDDNAFVFMADGNIPVREDLAVGVEFGYMKTGSSSVGGLSIDASAVSILAYGLYEIPAEGQPFTPFVKAGGGFIFSEYEVNFLGAKSSDTDSDLALAAGGGIEMDIDPASAFRIEAAIEYVDSDIDVVVGGDINLWVEKNFGLRAGAEYAMEDFDQLYFAGVTLKL